MCIVRIQNNVLIYENIRTFITIRLLRVYGFSYLIVSFFFFISFPQFPSYLIHLTMSELDDVIVMNEDGVCAMLHSFYFYQVKVL